MQEWGAKKEHNFINESQQSDKCWVCVVKPSPKQDSKGDVGGGCVQKPKSEWPTWKWPKSPAFVFQSNLEVFAVALQSNKTPQLTSEGFDQLSEKLQLLEHPFFCKPLPHAQLPHSCQGEPPCCLPELLGREEHTYGGMDGVAAQLLWGLLGTQGLCDMQGRVLGEGCPGRAQPHAGSTGQEAICCSHLWVLPIYSFVPSQPHTAKSLCVVFVSG